MPKYYVNKNAQVNGDHEVHKEGCRHMPITTERVYVGDFPKCTSAVLRAKKIYKTADGCRNCSRPCSEK